MNPDNHTQTPQEQQSIWEKRFSRRRALEYAGKGAVVGAAILAGCDITSINMNTVPSENLTPEQQSARHTLGVFNSILTDNAVNGSDERVQIASILTSAALSNGSKGNVLKMYQALNGQRGHYGDGTDPKPTNPQVATLTDIAILENLDITTTVGVYKDIYSSINNYYGLFAPGHFSDQSNLTINLTALSKLPGYDESSILGLLSDLNHFADHTDEITKDVINGGTGPIVFAKILEQKQEIRDNYQKLSNIAQQLKHNLVDASDGEISTLTLATMFDQGNTQQIENIYNIFHQPNNLDSNICTTLTLASVVDGFDHKKILSMFRFIKDNVQDMDDQTAAQLALATALKEAKLPPFLQDEAGAIDSSTSAAYVVIMLNNSSSYSGVEDTSSGDESSGEDSGGDGGEGSGGGDGE